MLGWFDPLYFLFLAPALILAGLATAFTRSTFRRYSRIGSARGLTGAQAARRLLDTQGLHGVRIERAHGFLSDHYDPVSRTLRLSADVFQSPSLAAVGVACHEAGHAIQHATGYAALGFRSAMVPATQFGSHGSYLFFMLGMFLNLQPLMIAGVLLFSLVVLFSLVTLPVEWNATARAKRLMVSSGIVGEEERDGAGAVLNAAFLTYLASAFTAILTLLYFVVRAGLLGGRDD